MSHTELSPADILRSLYARKGLEFDYYVSAHMRHGFVFSTPEFFIMGRPVVRGWTNEDIRNPENSAPRIIADGWYVHAMAGDTSKAWSVLPWPLGWIGFERFDESLRWIPTEVIRRFHPASLDEASSQSILCA